MNHGDRAWVATRKGLFELRCRAGDWRIERISFLGEPVSMLLPPQPDGAAGPAWTLQQLWLLEAAHGTAWAGTLPGGLFRSGDFGQSWQLIDTL